MTSRVSRQGWAMAVAAATAQRATCLRRAVGCVLLDVDGFILATGYNGVAAGIPHCNRVELVEDLSPRPMLQKRYVHTTPYACPGAHAPSGQALNSCHAIHAEQNALLRCADVRRIHACYCTTAPCITCTKLLLNTGCQMIYFRDHYPHPEAEELWVTSRGAGTWLHLTPDLEGTYRT